MPSYVMKPRKDRELYLVYSEISDSPVSGVGTREGMIDFLTCHYWRPHTREEAEARIERADRLGMSWAWTDHEAWDDEVVVNNGPDGTDGYYRHRDMAEVTIAYRSEDTERLKEFMIRPWPETEEVPNV